MRKVGFTIVALALMAAGTARADERLPGWSGFYLGVNAGYFWGRDEVHLSGDGDTGVSAGNALLNLAMVDSLSLVKRTYTRSLHGDAAAGGGQFGYNMQFGRVVAGLEADFQASGLDAAFSRSGSVSPIFLTIAVTQNLDWFGTVRGRFGHLVTDDVLLYGTAGFAYGRTEVGGALFNDTSASTGGSFPPSVIICPLPRAVCLSGAESKVSTGWTAGAGLEWAWRSNVTVRLEYLHLDLADQTILLTPVAPAFGTGYVKAEFDNVFDLLRIAVNLRF